MTGAVSQSLPIDLLEAGEQAIVSEVMGRHDLVVRLGEMGLHAGARICMIRPGSPCIIEINHQRLSIRFEESITILVDTLQ